MKEQIEIEELTAELIKTNSYGTLNAVAEYLYNAGYRKQKEGEWKYNEDCDCFVCSACGNSALNNYRGLSVNSNFCPNCGSKMKGGAK